MFEVAPRVFPQLKEKDTRSRWSELWEDGLDACFADTTRTSMPD